ncbi:MAG: tetratricopeptide repeat protein, partial [Candidatus Aerophobetes bacterium]|nr:tetratricopeptide repeat protein [Candidatus Aerophobetes bacterium]
MYEDLRKKLSSAIPSEWSVVWKKIRRRLLLYISLAAVIVAMGVAFSIFQCKMNIKAEAQFKLATSRYQEAENSQSSKERLAKYSEAKDLYEDILSRYPWCRNKKEILFYLGNCLYSLREYEQTIEILQKFSKKYKDDYFSPWAKVKLAFAYEQIGKYEEAINACEEVLKEHSDSCLAPEALLGMARCQELSKKWDEALKSYEEVLSRYPLSEQVVVAEVKIQQL